MNIINNSKTLKGYITYKICKKFINSLSENMKNIIDEFNTEVYITNIKKTFNYKNNYKGSYKMFFNKEGKKVIIYIDENNVLSSKSVMGHEIGHLIDAILGCFYNNVKITAENVEKFKYSLTNENINFSIKNESDFFIQITRDNQTEDEILLENYDIEEEFANCISELLNNNHHNSFISTKQLILCDFNKMIEEKNKKIMHSYNLKTV